VVSSSTPLGRGCNIWLLLHPRPNRVLEEIKWFLLFQMCHWTMGLNSDKTFKVFLYKYLQWRTNRKSHMVYRTAPFSVTLTPVRVRVMVRVRFRVGKVWKPYPNFQMVPPSMTLSDLWLTFQGHNNIQRPITRLTVSKCMICPMVPFPVTLSEP